MLKLNRAINFFGDGWILDAFFSEHGVNEFGFCFKCMNSFYVGHDDAARDVALVANQRSRHSHAETGKVEGQLGEIGQRSRQQPLANTFVQTRDLTSAPSTWPAIEPSHAGRRVAGLAARQRLFPGRASTIVAPFASLRSDAEPKRLTAMRLPFRSSGFRRRFCA